MQDLQDVGGEITGNKRIHYGSKNLKSSAVVEHI